jgi:hypothetical protein
MALQNLTSYGPFVISFHPEDLFMETYDNWLNNTLESIAAQKQVFSKRDTKKYKLDFLSRLAKRIADFSKECGECQKFQGDISKLAQDLGGLVQSSKEERKNYDRKIKAITGHLQKKHKLFAEGTYVGFGIALGPAIGVAIGSGMGNVGAGIGIGVGIGVAIGSALEANAKKNGKII